MVWWAGAQVLKRGTVVGQSCEWPLLQSCGQTGGWVGQVVCWAGWWEVGQAGVIVGFGPGVDARVNSHAEVCVDTCMNTCMNTCMKMRMNFERDLA